MSESPIADASCSKCGGTDIRWFWHKTSWGRASMRDAKHCGYGDTAQPTGEHLHGYCQTCHYDFFEDVAQ